MNLESSRIIVLAASLGLVVPAASSLQLVLSRPLPSSVLGCLAALHTVCTISKMYTTPPEGGI